MVEQYESSGLEPQPASSRVANVMYHTRRFVQAMLPVVELGEAFHAVLPYQHNPSKALRALQNTGNIELMVGTGVGVGIGIFALQAAEQFFNSRLSRQTEQSVIQ